MGVKFELENGKMTRDILYHVGAEKNKDQRALAT